MPISIRRLSRTVLNTIAKILWVLLLAAVVIWYGFFRTGNEATYAVEHIEFDLAQEIYGNNSAAQTHGTGPIAVVLYSNYLCPFCRELWNNLDTVIRDDSTSLTINLRHLVRPIRGNPAYLAALGAECAGDQGRFSTFHRIALASQDHLSTVSIDELARQADIPDLPRFSACVNGEVHKSRIAATLIEAQYLSLIGTPAMVVDQRLITGTPGLLELRELLSPGSQTAWMN